LELVRRGVVVRVDDFLDRVLVDVDGHPEPISFPADAVKPRKALRDALIDVGDHVEADVGREHLQAVHVRIAARAASGS
jgi:hypothetical protein